MSTSVERNLEVLEALRRCAAMLLSEYEKNESSVYWEAYERAAQACELIYFSPLVRQLLH